MQYKFAHPLFQVAAEQSWSPCRLEVILELKLAPRERGRILAHAINLGCTGAASETEENCAQVLLECAEVERLEFRSVSAYELLQAACLLPRASQVTLCNVHRRASILCDWLGRAPEALSHVNCAIGYAKSTADHAMLARLVSDRGILELYHQGPGVALESFRSAAETAKGVAAVWVQAMALGNAGVASRHLGAIEDAIKYVHQAEDLYRTIGDMEGVARKMSERANLLCTLGEHERALDLADEAVSIRELLRDSRELAMGWGVKAHILMEIGRLMEARTYLVSAGQIFDQLSSHRESAMTHLKLGCIAMNLGDQQTAESEALAALQTADASGAHGIAIDALTDLAVLRVLTLSPHEAVSLVEKGLARCQDLSDTNRMPLLLCTRGWAAYVAGNTETAELFFRDAQASLPKEGSGPTGISVHAGLAQIAVAEKDFESARRHAVTGLEHSTISDPGLILEHLACLQALVAVEAATGNTDEAHALHSEARNRLKKLQQIGGRPLPLLERMLSEMEDSLRQTRL